MKKIKDVTKLILFIFCISMILHDMFIIITGGSYTLYGALTYIIFYKIAITIYDDFKEQIKSTLISDQTFRKGTNK